MSADDAEGRDDAAPPHPRETTALFGHGEAEQTLLEAYRSGRIPHAWLIGGAPGIGKATLAYRMARFVLANPNPTAPAVRKAKSLRCRRMIAHSGASPPRGIPISWCSSGSSTRRPASSTP